MIMIKKLFSIASVLMISLGAFAQKKIQTYPVPQCDNNAKYMPTKLFDNPKCPQVSTLSFGLKLNF